jgi:hypothetical protein
MADHNTREGEFRRGFGGVALGGALAAFFISPLVKFADPVVLAVGGALAGMGLLGLYNARVVPGVKPVAEKVAWVFIVLGGFAVAVALVFATEASWSVDGYCAGVQERMIANAGQGTSIGDAKDVLQALQCRPQEIAPLRVIHAVPAQAALLDLRSGSAAQTR